MEKLMEISHVGYSYHTMQGETPALSNINFTVHKGDFLAIVGPSGCGKSTFLKCINRMNDLVDGVKIEGRLLLDGTIDDIKKGGESIDETVAQLYRSYDI